MFAALAHNVAGLPILLAAAEKSGLGLRSNLDVGLGITRETVITSWFLMGMCMAALGGVLLLISPGLRRGDATARRIAFVLAMFFLTIFLAPWFAFEHMVPHPLPVPFVGLVLFVLLLRSRAR